MHRIAAIALVVLTAASPAAAQPAAARSSWIALAEGGFIIPDGRTALDMLVEMNPLLGSEDPVLRDNVAYSAAERWVRDRRLSPADLRALIRLWTGNLDEGLGTAGDARVFKRSFSALSLSVIAAADLSAPFLEPAEVQALFDRLLDYFQRERDLRGFDPVRGWMHSVAHTSDALKFLARNPKLAAGADVRMLAAVRAEIESHDAVFTWGENDRMALALYAAVRRPDSDAAALRTWTEDWVHAHQALWARGPQIDPRRFAQIENARQVMRSVQTAFSQETDLAPRNAAALRALLAALGQMR